MRTTTTSDIFRFDISAAKQALNADGIGLPPHTYTDQQIFDCEIALLHGRAWTCFAPLEKLAHPGSVITGQVGKVPVIVSRARDGNIHGFVNACRHRGYTVVERDRAKCLTLTCRYHSWSYDLSGNLIAAPDSEESFDKTSHGLLPISVEVWGPFIFVNPDPDAKPLQEAMDRLEPVARQLGFDGDPERYRLMETTENDQNANWKLWWENATECYHCPTIHASTFGANFQSRPENAVFQNSGFVTATSFPPSSDDPALKPATAIHLFPGCHLVQETGLMVMSRIVPKAPDLCTVIAYYFGEVDADESQVRNTVDLWKRTYAEDFEVVRHQQATLASGRTRPFRYVPSREFQVIQHVQNVLTSYESMSARQQLY